LDYKKFNFIVFYKKGGTFFELFLDGGSLQKTSKKNPFIGNHFLLKLGIDTGI